MKYSKLLIPTLREEPADAECASHKLMLRAGMIRQVARGIYNYLPLGLRVIKKVEKIVREEMDAAGCQEVLLPIVIPAELWQESGRWERYGKELLRVKDRSNRDFCIGPTHEEVITDLVRREIKSYRDLPINLYQINTKYRDEVRPRFGLMRGREFIMKDGYSFHTSVEDLDNHYEVMKNAYLKIFQRCGLNARAVEADTGAIGGYSSHELVVLADTGESIIVTCNKCDYTASAEIAAFARPAVKKGKATSIIKEVRTPSLKTVEEVASYLKVEPSQMIKTLVYLADKGLVVALIAGNLELNEVKLANALGAAFLTMADEATIKKLTGADTGFAGPVSLPAEVAGIGKVSIVADISIEGIINAVTGANKTDYHITGVCEGRDFKAEKYIDLSAVKKGDVCSKCGEGKIDIGRGIEVGQVFKLGTKYSEALKAVFLDENGKEKPIIMGTYGIGIGRTAAAAIEQNNDENGIIWPLPLAPFHVELISVGDDSKVIETAEKVYEELTKSGIEVLFDDRGGRPGVKFADADLIGIPYQAIVGKKALEQGKIELKIRKTGERQMVGVKDIIELVKKELHL